MISPEERGRSEADGPPNPPMPANSNSEPYGAGDEISLIELANLILRNRRLIVLLPITLAVVVVAYSLAQPRTYSAKAMFVAQTAQSGPAAVLANQFGIDLGSDNASQSPQFYADLLRSLEVRRQAVESEYTIGGGNTGPARATLISIYGIEGGGAVPAWRRAADRLEGQLAVNVARETGIVELEVSAESPALAEQIAARILHLLNDFNVRTRRTQVVEEKEFLAGRVLEARDSLLAAENRLEAFLERNRQFSNSPELSFEHDRYKRQVAMQQQIFTTLVESYEQARINAVREAPVFTVLQQPAGLAMPEARGTLRKGFLALMFGGIVAIGTAYLRETGKRARKDSDDEYREFLRLRREAFLDVRHPARFLRRKPATPEEIGGERPGEALRYPGSG